MGQVCPGLKRLCEACFAFLQEQESFYLFPKEGKDRYSYTVRQSGAAEQII